MNISVAIPTIGRVETLSMTLMSLAFQDQKIEEVIILDESDIPICEHYPVTQAIDFLSIEEIPVKVIRNRHRKGIGNARYVLAEEAKHEYVFMIDDDVVLHPRCLEELVHGHRTYKPTAKWIVPTCLLIPKIEADGYSDKLVDYHDSAVSKWTSKYPWFIPYFRYNEIIAVEISCAGTQAILFHRKTFLKKCEGIKKLGILPREDTYMTSKMGKGLFVSLAECYHMEHPSQKNRGEWSSSMFYRLHEAIIKDPDMFLKFIGQ